jgi:hypothetical protein
VEIAMNTESHISINLADIEAITAQARIERSQYLAQLIAGAFKRLGRRLQSDDEPLPLRPNQRLPQAWA